MTVNISTILFLIPIDGEISVSHLAEKIQHIDPDFSKLLKLPQTKLTLYQSITRLEEQEYVKSRVLENRGNEKIISLTESGKHVVFDFRAFVFQSDVVEDIDNLVEEFGSNLKEKILKFLSRIR
jgi:DNA-binding PadR family transcriptional regulator